MARSRNFALTWNLERYDIRFLTNTIDVIDMYLGELKGYTIGAIEEGKENDYKHCHVLLCFVNPIEFSSVVDYYKGLHVEIVSSYKNYRNYMKKDGPFQFDNLFANTQDDEYLEDLINCCNFKEFLRLHPELIKSIDKYEKAFNILNER